MSWHHGLNKFFLFSDAVEEADKYQAPYPGKAMYNSVLSHQEMLDFLLLT